MNGQRENQADRTCDLLGITADSSFEDAKRAFRFASRANHPDRNPDDPFAAARFKSINAGWELLGTRERWAVYQASRGSPGASSGPRKPSPQDEATAADTISRRTIRLQRVQAYAGSAVRWSVWLDGTFIAKIGVGRFVDLDISSRPHELSVSYALGQKSKPLSLELSDGDRCFLRCGPETFLKAFFQPKQGVRLERVA